MSGYTGAQLLGQELFGKVGGTLWWGGGRATSYVLKALLFAAVSPFVYLIGPAWVLRLCGWVVAGVRECVLVRVCGGGGGVERCEEALDVGMSVVCTSGVMRVFSYFNVFSY